MNDLTNKTLKAKRIKQHKQWMKIMRQGRVTRESDACQRDTNHIQKQFQKRLLSA